MSTELTRSKAKDLLRIIVVVPIHLIWKPQGVVTIKHGSDHRIDGYNPNFSLLKGIILTWSRGVKTWANIDWYDKMCQTVHLRYIEKVLIDSAFFQWYAIDSAKRGMQRNDCRPLGAFFIWLFRRISFWRLSSNAFKESLFDHFAVGCDDWRRMHSNYHYFTTIFTSCWNLEWDNQTTNGQIFLVDIHSLQPFFGVRMNIGMHFDLNPLVHVNLADAPLLEQCPEIAHRSIQSCTCL